MVYYVTVSGVDGCGKSTAFNQVSERLSNTYGLTVVQVRKSAWIDKPNEERQYFGGIINDTFDALHFWADRKDQRTLVGIVNLLYAPFSKGMKTYARVLHNPDFILSYRDTILDPIAYTAYYFPFTAHWSLEARLHMLKLFGSGRRSDLIFYMDLDPQEAYARILQRIESEAELVEKQGGEVDRRKFHHMHETPENLAFLQEQFEVVIAFAQKNLDLNIVRIDAAQSGDQVVEAMMTYIRTINVNKRNRLS